MKILTFCDYPVYMCFYKALSDVGNYVIVKDLNKIPESVRPSYMAKVMDEEHPDVILTIGRPEVHLFSEEYLYKLCRLRGILNVYWATEDRTYHQKYSMKVANNFDFIFTPAQECIKDYNSIGKSSGILKYGCYPQLHRNLEPRKEFMTDIVIAASYHRGLNCNYVKNVINAQENDSEENLRKNSVETLIYPLVEKGYNISIWGNGWDSLVPSKYVKGYYPYEDLNVLYSSAKIVLGLEWDSISETKTTGRPYEVLGCRSFFLTLRTKALSNIFKDRIHLALTGSKEETLELVDYYLNNDAERNKIAQEGQKEVYSKHTYYHRAGEFMNALKPFMKNKI